MTSLGFGHDSRTRSNAASVSASSLRISSCERWEESDPYTSRGTRHVAPRREREIGHCQRTRTATGRTTRRVSSPRTLVLTDNSQAFRRDQHLVNRPMTLPTVTSVSAVQPTLEHGADCRFQGTAHSVPLQGCLDALSASYSSVPEHIILRTIINIKMCLLLVPT